MKEFVAPHSLKISSIALAFVVPIVGILSKEMIYAPALILLISCLYWFFKNRGLLTLKSLSIDKVFLILAGIVFGIFMLSSVFSFIQAESFSASLSPFIAGFLLFLIIRTPFNDGHIRLMVASFLIATICVLLIVIFSHYIPYYQYVYFSGNKPIFIKLTGGLKVMSSLYGFFIGGGILFILLHMKYLQNNKKIFKILLPAMSVIFILFFLPDMQMLRSHSAMFGLWVGGAVTMVIYLASKLSWKRRLLLFCLLTIIAVVNISWIYKKLPGTEIFDENITHQLNNIPLVTPHREIIWGFAKLKIQDGLPLFGHGVDMSPRIEGAKGPVLWANGEKRNVEFIPSHPHNSLLEIILDTGFLGMAAIISFVLYWMHWLVGRIHKNRAQGLLLTWVTCYFFTTGFSSFSIWSFWWQIAFASVYGLFWHIGNYKIQESR
jgi:O-antigen ligase